MTCNEQSLPANGVLAGGMADKPIADFILIIDGSTSYTSIKSIEAFVRSQTTLAVDTWDVSFRDGLPGDRPDGPDAPSIYPRKTYVFLASDFCRGLGNDGHLDAFSRMTLRRHIKQGGACLFLNCHDFAAYERHLRQVLGSRRNLPHLAASARPMDVILGFNDLLQRVSAARRNDELWFRDFVVRPSARLMRGEAKDRLKQMEKDRLKLKLLLPQERFTVAFHPLASGGLLTVSSGLPHRVPLAAVRPLQSAGGDLLSQYMLVASLPLKRRAALLWDGDADLWSNFARDCLVLSLGEGIGQERKRLLSALSKNLTLLPGRTHQPSALVDTLIKLHLPTLFEVLERGRGRISAQTRYPAAELVLQEAMDLAASKMKSWRKKKLIACARVCELIWRGIRDVAPPWGIRRGGQDGADPSLMERIVTVTQCSRSTLDKRRRDWNDVDPDDHLLAESRLGRLRESGGELLARWARSLSSWT